MYAYMRKSSVLLLTAFFISTGPLLAQGLKNVLGRKNADSTAPKTSGGLGNLVNKVAGAGGGNLTTTEVVEGLKQALEVGVQRGAGKLSAVDGYFGNALLRILLPPEAQQVERTLRGLGMGQLVDDAILSMNRAAEEAAKEAAPIFVNAIKGITVDDGWAILRGSDSAATQFLKGKTIQPRSTAPEPVNKKAPAAPHNPPPLEQSVYPIQ